ncbi:hypothetical protein K402DRAFT_106385 [Aulographum hederae CBS 113979]|uniref:Uncharacterized protein n=1 Tax=Aulographum hederae CBS 113979 TaxID=1176131 RepID=A0A6G1GY90_9PEZI|nr:hypothetical protein K402DRAFT_106385 [Aulographum hederae CBS 113979]
MLQIRHLNIHIDADDSPLTVTDQWRDTPPMRYSTTRPRPYLEYDQLSQARRQEYLHDTRKVSVVTAWGDAFQCLQQFKSIRTLQVDIGNTYCPYGCCRDLRVIAFALGDLVQDVSVSKVPVFGARHDTETDHLRAGIVEWHDYWGEELENKNVPELEFARYDHYDDTSPWDKYTLIYGTDQWRRKKGTKIRHHW